MFVGYLKNLRAIVDAGKPLDRETLTALLDIAEGGWDLLNSGNDSMATAARRDIHNGFRKLDKTKPMERAKL